MSVRAAPAASFRLAFGAPGLLGNGWDGRCGGRQKGSKDSDYPNGRAVFALVSMLNVGVLCGTEHYPSQRNAETGGLTYVAAIRTSSGPWKFE
jgi:hypothetical protein